jgi:hypothetical protein
MILLLPLARYAVRFVVRAWRKRRAAPGAPVELESSWAGR